MLGIQRLKMLAAIVGFTETELRDLKESADDYVKLRTSWDPVRKSREVICVTGQLRKFQERFHLRVLQPNLRPSRWSHGAVKGRNLASHVREHASNIFAYKTDVASFYPSIGIDRVNRYFLTEQGCSPEVSSFLTRLCTHDYHLALGLITSPILANQLMLPLDARIGRLCEAHNCVYTRWVDDLTISAQWDFSNSGLPEKVNQILESHGMVEKLAKREFGELENGLTITGLRVSNGRVDVSTTFLNELHRQLDDHASLSMDGKFFGPYQSYSQLAGRVHYATWVNANRRCELSKKLRAIDWKAVERVAGRRRLIVKRKTVTPRGQVPPAYASSVARSDA